MLRLSLMPNILSNLSYLMIILLNPFLFSVEYPGSLLRVRQPNFDYGVDL
jgi:hypothetical protein